MGSQRVGHDWATFTSLHLWSLVSQRRTFKHSHLCVLSPWTETKPVTASTLRQRFCEKAKSHGYALNAEGRGKEAMTCKWRSAHGIQPPLSFGELHPAAIEKGWDLGPFAAVLQNLHLDKCLPKLQNTNCEGLRDYVHAAVGASYEQKRYTKVKKPNCHWRPKSQKRVSGTNAGCSECPLHTTLP